jgi:hypothetical protein
MRIWGHQKPVFPFGGKGKGMEGKMNKKDRKIVQT